MCARERADDVLRMYRLARTGGSLELLRWLAGRAEGWAGLLAGDGTVLRAAAGDAECTGQEAAELAAEGAGELRARDARAYSLDKDTYTALLLPLDGHRESPAPVLAVVVPRPVPAGLSMLLADAVMPVTMAWATESVERKRRRVDLAESRSREAVLHLLMTGQLSIAHQVAGALRPKLPDPVRVCVVECSGGRRDEVAQVCAEVSGGRSWIVRCPVYAHHLILVMPVGPEAEGGAERGASGSGAVIAALVDDCVVGVSEEVPLSDTATGYRQAFHALAVARGLPGRQAGFGSSPEPALVVGSTGRNGPTPCSHRCCPTGRAARGPGQPGTRGDRRVLARLRLPCDPAPEDPPQHPGRPAETDRRAARPRPEPGRRPGRPRPGPVHPGHTGVAARAPR